MRTSVRTTGILLRLYACAVLGGCASTDQPLPWRYSSQGPQPPLGLSVLNTDLCSLILEGGESIPPEVEDHLVVKRDGGKRIVRGPADLVDCVKIATTSDALTYLRFFSSLSTSHLFEPQQVEVGRGRPFYLLGPDRGDCFVCLPRDRWNQLGLHDPDVRSEGSSFIVERFVARPHGDTGQADLLRLRARVAMTGTVEILDESLVQGLSVAERVGLSPPRYL